MNEEYEILEMQAWAENARRSLAANFEKFKEKYAVELSGDGVDLSDTFEFLVAGNISIGIAGFLHNDCDFELDVVARIKNARQKYDVSGQRYERGIPIYRPPALKSPSELGFSPAQEYKNFFRYSFFLLLEKGELIATGISKSGEKRVTIDRKICGGKTLQINWKSNSLWTGRKFDFRKARHAYSHVCIKLPEKENFEKQHVHDTAIKSATQSPTSSGNNHRPGHADWPTVIDVVVRRIKNTEDGASSKAELVRWCEDAFGAVGSQNPPKADGIRKHLGTHHREMYEKADAKNRNT